MTWNGQYLLTASGTTATVRDLAVGTGLSPRLGLPENPVLTKISEGELVVQTGKRVYRIDTSALTLNPVSTMLTYMAPLASPSLDRSASFVGKGLISFHARKPDQETETKLCEWQCPGGNVDMWQFSPDGSLFVATAGERCWVLDPGNGRVKSEFTLPGSARYTPFVTVDNRYVFNLYPKDRLNYEHGLHGWDLGTGRELVFQFNDALRNPLRYPFVSVSPDSRWLAIASVSTGGTSVGTTFLWDLQNLHVAARELVSPGAICQLEFSPDGKKLALASVNGGVQTRSLETGELLAPTLDPGGSALTKIAFSPDSLSIATSVTTKSAGTETPSEIRVWDWLEALPITRVFPVPTVVSHLHFTPDGRSLLAIFPRKGKPAESIVQAWEIAPPMEIAPLLLPLSEAATAYHIEAGNLPTAIDPFHSWEVFRKAQPDSWFLQAPEDRTVSPAFPAASMRWIKDELVEIDALLAAMPCVALSNAAIANWRQTHLANLSDHTSGQDDTSTKATGLADSIARLRVIPERNLDAHPLIPYYLALQARGEPDAARLKKYSQLAYERNPENADCAELAAEMYEDAGDYPSALPILRKIHVLAPDNHEYCFRLGTALWALGRKTEAQAEFAIGTDSKHLTDLHRAIMLVYMGRASEALPVFEKIADAQKAASPDKSYHFDSLVYLVTGHLSAGNKEAAAGFFEQLVTAAPRVAEPETIRKANLHPLLTECLLSAIKLKE
jgi:WD40 repeat protein/tetratricopeptide (TPR) repeat protein